MVASSSALRHDWSKSAVEALVHPRFDRLNAVRHAGERELGTRYYQIEAWSAILSSYERGIRKPLLVMPTGTGKTVTFATIAWLMGQKLGRTPRGLILVHRAELVDQTIEALRRVYPEASVGRIAGADCTYTADITVAMVPTLGREDKDHPKGWSWKLRRYIAKPVDLVVVDESHHSPVPTYLRVLDATLAASTLRLGVTATPNRSDGLALSDVYDEIVYQYSLVQAIDDRFLVRPHGIRHRLRHANLDHAKVSKSNGDFSESSLAKVFNTAEGRAETIATWEKHAVLGRPKPLKTILFACTVEHARRLSEDLNARGYRSATISQDTQSDARRTLYRSLKSGELDVLLSITVLTEGFDEPSVECVTLVRPTQSWSLFVQMVGRGLRLFPGKTECLILDISGNTERFSLIGLNMLGGFQLEEDDETATSQTSKEKEPHRPCQQHEQGALAITVGDGYRVDLVQIKKAGRFDWEETEHGLALMLGAPDTGGIFLLRQHDPDRDKMPVKCANLFKIVHLQRLGDRWRAEVVAQKMSAHEAMALCEQEAPRLGGKRTRAMVDLSAIGPASTEQVDEAIADLVAQNREVNARLSRPMRDAAVSASVDQRRRLRHELDLGQAADDPRIVKGEAMRIIGWAAQVSESKARLGIAALRSAWNLTSAQVAELVARGDLVRMVTHGWRTGFTQIQRPAYLAEVAP